jgi:hypothetical protein
MRLTPRLLRARIMTPYIIPSTVFNTGKGMRVIARSV